MSGERSRRPTRSAVLARRTAPDGVRIRVGTRREDLPGLAALRTACNAADGTEGVPTVEVLANEIAHASGFDPLLDDFLAERDGEIAGWARVSVSLMSTGAQVFEAIVRVHPKHRGQGIGRALVRRCEARIRERAMKEPHAGRRLIAAYATDTAAGARHLYESEGYGAVRYFFHMIRDDLEDLATPVMPNGIEVRPVRNEDIDARALRAAAGAPRRSRGAPPVPASRTCHGPDAPRPPRGSGRRHDERRPLGRLDERERRASHHERLGFRVALRSTAFHKDVAALDED